MTAQGTTRRPSPPSTSPDADSSSSLLSSLRRTLSKFHEAVGGGGGGIGIDGAGDGTTGAAADAREEESKEEGGDDSEDRRVFRPHDPSVGFRERLATFRPEVYFAKPDEISPLICARFGWECTEARDVLSCTHPSCRGAVCVWLGEEQVEGMDRTDGGDGDGEAASTSDPPDHDEVEGAAIARAAGPEVVRTLCGAYRKMLATGHDVRTCPWRSDAERWLILDDDDECESDGASAGGGEGDDRSVDGRSSDVDVVVVPPFLLSVLPQLVIFEGPCVVDIGDDEDGGVRGRLVRSEARTRALELDRVLDDASAASVESDASGAKNRRRRLCYDVAVPEELSSFLREGMLALRRRRRGRARADGDDEGDPESGNGEEGDNCQDPAGYIGRVLNSNVDLDGVGDDDDGPGAPMKTSGTADVTGGSSLLAALGWSPCLPNPLMTEDGSRRLVRMECRICLSTGDVGLTEAYDQSEDGGDDDDKARDTASSAGKKRRRPSPAGGGLVDPGDADGGLERSDFFPEIAEEAQMKKMRTGGDSSSSSSPGLLRGERASPDPTSKRPSPKLTNVGEGELANDAAQLKADAEGGARLDPVNSHRHFCPYVGGSLSLSTRRRRLRVGGSLHVIDCSATRNGGPHPVEESGPPPPPMTMIQGWQIVLGVLLRGAGTDEDDKEDDGDGGPSSSPVRTGHPKTESWREALLAVNRALEPAGSY